MQSRSNNPFYKILILLFLISTLFLMPIPYYQSLKDCQKILCKSGGICYCNPGWHLGIPVWALIIQQYYEFTRTPTFFPIYNFLHSVSKEVQCKKNEDCAVNTCDCKAVHQDSLQPNDKICTRYCPGIPVCDRGRCLLDTTKSTQKYSCPPGEWVNCMPGPDAKSECSSEAIAWYKKNCPNFKGAAL